MHGGGFFFFRDRNIAAYPALRRDPINADPFFARRQAGFNLGGPLKKNRLFFFTTLEHLNQQGAVTAQSRTPELASLGGIFPSDLTGKQITVRLDNRLTETNSLFLRYSHDGNDGFVPRSSTGSLPSNWSLNTNWADQSIISLNNALGPKFINEMRFSYWYWHARNLPPTRERCPGSALVWVCHRSASSEQISWLAITRWCRREETRVVITPPTT